MDTFSQKLLMWFDDHGRHDLPWQYQQTSYRVWVSEIMLQQTQVKTVVPFYQGFMARFPTLESLAQAHQDEVLAHWSGLGYYARGRNLHKAAQIMVQQHGGQFPNTFDEVLALPGIGRSTAGAILAMAQKQRHAILDGNVKRVLCRYEAIEGWPGKKAIEGRLWQLAERFTPEKRFDDYTQAIMDLGATVCSRSKPSCKQCPVQGGCQAYQTDTVGRFPFSKPKKSKPTKQAKLLMLVNKKQHIWLEKRPQAGIWGGLWSLPQFESEQALISALSFPDKSDSKVMESLIKWKEFKHTFSHYHLNVEPIISVESPPANWQGQWLELSQAHTLGLPAPVKKILEQLENHNVKNG